MMLILRTVILRLRMPLLMTGILATVPLTAFIVRKLPCLRTMLLVGVAVAFNAVASELGIFMIFLNVVELLSLLMMMGLAVVVAVLLVLSPLAA